MAHRSYLVLSSLLGISAVGIGALGAHALRARLIEAGTLDAWDTAVKYHLTHSIAFFAASLALAAEPKNLRGEWLRRAAGCWLGGVVLFSGSLYGLALGGPRWLGPVTPMGGLTLIAGWIFVALAATPRTRV